MFHLECTLVTAMLSFKKRVTTKLTFPYKAQLVRIVFERPAGSWWAGQVGDTIKLVWNVLYILRIMLIYLDWTTNTDAFWWSNLDVAYRIVIGFRLFEANFFLFIVLFIIYGLYLNYFLYYVFIAGAPDVLHCYRQLNFDNPRAVLSKFDKVSARNVLKVAQLIGKLVRKDEETLRPIRFRHRLSMFPMLTKENRVNVFLLYLCSESIILFLMLSFPFLAALVLYLFLPILRTLRGSWFDWLVAVETGRYIGFGCYSVLKGSSTIMCMVLVTTSTITLYLGQLNRFLRDTVHKTRMQRVTLHRQLFGFYREHHRMSKLINSLADHWKAMLSVAIWTNIPLNVNAFTVIFLSGHQIDGIHSIFVAILLFQFAFGFVTVHPAAYNATAAHRAGKYMVPLQPKITNLRLKLKWEHYHEIVHNSKLKIAYKVSLFGRLTVFSIFKFMLFYLEEVIFVYSKH